jgi:hypothetical protein
VHPEIVPHANNKADRFTAFDRNDGRFFISGYVDHYSDCLSFTIVAKIRSTGERSTIPPGEFFDSMMNHFKQSGGDPECIRGIWNDSEPEKMSNLNSFNAALAAGKSEVESAKETFTGKMAAKYNYTLVSFGVFDPPMGPPPYKSANAYFRKSN